MKRSSRSFAIALSAIACAVASLALTLGSYVDVLFAAGYLIAIFALMVPLSKQLYWADALAFLGAVLLAFLFCGFAILKLLPFVAFFGLHPLINALQKRYIHKKWMHGLCFLGKAIWFDGALLLFWFVVGPLLGMQSTTWYPYVEPYLYYAVFFGGTLFFAAYDYLIFLCQRSVDRAVARIGR